MKDGRALTTIQDFLKSLLLPNPYQKKSLSFIDKTLFEKGVKPKPAIDICRGNSKILVSLHLHLPYRSLVVADQ